MGKLEQINSKWQNVLDHMIESQGISQVSVQTWLLPMKPVAYDESSDVLSILCPDVHFLSFMEKKYSITLPVSIETVADIHCTVRFVTEDMLSPAGGEEKPAAKKPDPASSQMDARVKDANLNPKYTFETFVVGKNNNFAHAAALAVAESPGNMYNPLFIYGGVGLGKTHLMHSIGHFILKNNPDAKVLYVTSEKFTNELIDAIRNKDNISTTEFRNKYRNNDVLLIDDIQFIIGKDSTQEEFFNTFNALYEAQKQIVISSDKPPKQIETLEERLKSRFEQGLTVDIQSPDYETRMAILRKKEEMDGFNIDNEVIKFIANNIKSNIRQLEGALTKVVALSKLNKQEITVELAEEALKDLISPNEKHEVTPELILNVVADHYGITPNDIISQKRSREVVVPRQIVMYLCRQMTSTPLKTIGNYLGGRDHTTILHGQEKIAQDITSDESLKNTIDVLIKKINTQ
ncbi:chromosomal replication initiator protein DnaA [[Clostridium] aminophilum]|uniref:chromosomal replication initiator protein DnaA n=1 Tax=[Clostridium] aminophilum TaxID=1526 RepID=UPI00332B9AAB